MLYIMPFKEEYQSVKFTDTKLRNKIKLEHRFKELGNLSTTLISNVDDDDKAGDDVEDDCAKDVYNLCENINR